MFAHTLLQRGVPPRCHCEEANADVAIQDKRFELVRNKDIQHKTSAWFYHTNIAISRRSSWIATSVLRTSSQ